MLEVREMKELINTSNNKAFTSNDYMTDNLTLRLVSLKIQMRDDATHGRIQDTYLNYLHGLHLIDFFKKIQLIKDSDYYSLTKYWDSEYFIDYEQALKAAHPSTI